MSAAAHTQKRQVAKGVVQPNGTRGIVCYFDPETFEAIRERALRAGTSFGEQVRCLVEWGLEEGNAK